MSAADELASTEAERRCLEALREASGDVNGPMERHCVRCFLLAERLAGRRGLEIDRELMLCASLLHDAGLYPAIGRGGVYTADGGAYARDLLEGVGWDEARAARCEQAIALHHDTREQLDLGAEVELMRLADRIEVLGGLVTEGLDRAEVREIFARIPRRGMYAHIGRLLAPIFVRRPLSLLKIFRARA
jgi:HD superfamily phosphodiesterase